MSLKFEDSDKLSYFSQREYLIDAITGANGFKKTYYAELKRKLTEIENKNIELKKVIFSLENISELINSITKGLPELFINISRIITNTFNAKYVIFLLDSLEYKEISPFIMFNIKNIKYYSYIPDNFKKTIDFIKNKSDLYIDRNYLKHFSTICLSFKKNGIFLGAIYLKTHRNNNFLDIDIHLLQILSNLFIISLDNYNFIKESEYLRKIAEERKKELERKIIELEETRSQLTNVQKNQIISEERNRIALDLHDTIAQLFLTIGLNIEWCLKKLPIESEINQKLKATQNLSQQAVDQLRKTIFELSISPEQSILGLLYDLSKEFEDLAHIKVKILTFGNEKKYSPLYSNTIRMLLSESLHNIAKHAKANTVEINVNFLKDKTIVTISDDGIGIKGRNIKKITEGKTFGLKIMLKKIKELKGNMEIVSSNSKGTKIIFTIPDE